MERVKSKTDHPPKRAAGVLLPVSSLSGDYGIGTLGAAARRFVDFLQAAGQRYWQVLPVGPSGGGHSPYQSVSAFAGNPLFIDPQTLYEKGLLEKSERCEVPEASGVVDFERVEALCFARLRAAFQRSKHQQEPIFRAFCARQSLWLSDYALFMAVKAHVGGAAWNDWEGGIKQRTPAAMERYKRLLRAEIEFWKFVQYEFFSQWSALKRYANDAGIRIVGDIPLYVSGDSVDTWVNRDIFLMDGEGKMTCVGGVPPDDFSDEGQNWNVPVYDWAQLEATDFVWWERRMAAAAELYDIVRIDHFIGLARYYSIAGVNAPASNGQWKKGPGMKLLRAIERSVPLERLIAENLGVHMEEAVQLLRKSGLPGMNVLAFAFDQKPNNANLPHNFTKNSVVYGGTHDNDTLRGYLENDPRAHRQIAEYLGRAPEETGVWDIVRMGYASVADTAIFQMQDYLALGGEARMNVPGTIGGKNWRWRVREDQLNDKLARRMRDMAQQYGRTKYSQFT